MDKKVTIVLLGDSITQGIGKRQINYETMLKDYLRNNEVESNIVNLALTGTTIEHALEQLPKIKKYNPDYIVIMYGSVDLQVRPNMETNKWGILSITPKRYKNIKGMLNPRPFMSSRKGRYVLDCLDNLYRKIWRQVVVITQGTMQYFTNIQFEEIYKSVLSKLRDYKVILSSTMYVDSQIYTNETIENYDKANIFLQNLGKEYNNIVGYANLYDMQKENVTETGTYNEIYCQDHFHPNENGYQEIAKVLGELIVSDFVRL